MRWVRSHRADRRALRLADEHYTRQQPGTPQFVKPSSNIVLLTPQADALWTTVYQLPQYVKHSWPGALECSHFRNESPHLSSELIREALAATAWWWTAKHRRKLPEEGMITFVGIEETRAGRSPHHQPGHCFIKAGFKLIEIREDGKAVLHIWPDYFPEPCAPLGAQLRLIA